MCSLGNYNTVFYMLSAVEQLVDAGLYQFVVGSEFLCTARIVAIVSMDYFTRFTLYAVHVCFRHRCCGGSLWLSYGWLLCKLCRSCSNFGFCISRI